MARLIGGDNGGVELPMAEVGPLRRHKVGDVAHVKAGERHWHGAKADTTMGHITITLASGKATWG